MSLAGTRDPRHHAAGPPVPTTLFPEHIGPDRRLEMGERDPLDAYWTPFACALACCQAIVDAELDCLPPITPVHVLEPAVGGGSWVRAVRQVWPEAITHAVDLDPESPGLRMADRQRVGDFLELRLDRRDMVIGNPPYGGDITRWLDRSLELAPVVAYLLRSTVLGSSDRAPWWLAHPPAVVWTLSPRPRWQGPGRRPESDTCDSVLVLWVEGQTDTRHRWLPWVPA